MKTNLLIVTWLVALATVSPPAPAAVRMADFVAYFELGQNPAGGPAWLNPANALADNGAGLSLGNWDDYTDPTPLPPDWTGGFDVNQGLPAGLVVGFNQPVPNGGPGVMDLMVMGNPLTDPATGRPYWYEPGYIEVARETTDPQASPQGWADETFYLIKPGNYDLLKTLYDNHQVSQYDPRLGPLEIRYTWAGPNDGDQGAADSYLDDYWKPTSQTRDLYGYADVHPDGDWVDLSDAIDLAGQPVSLPDISYVRIRTVTNSPADRFGSFSTEVMYVAAGPPDLPGDFNADGQVEQDDLTLLLSSWGRTTVPPQWTGDFDGLVDQSELNALLANWGSGVTAGPAPLGRPVPLPTGALLLAILAAGLPHRSGRCGGNRSR